MELTLLQKTFLVISIFAALPAVLMIFIYKKDDVSFSQVYQQGTFINRHMEKYIKKQHVKKIMLLWYIAIGSFLCLVASILISVFSRI